MDTTTTGRALIVAALSPISNVGLQDSKHYGSAAYANVLGITSLIVFRDLNN